MLESFIIVFVFNYYKNTVLNQILLQTEGTFCLRIVIKLMTAQSTNAGYLNHILLLLELVRVGFGRSKCEKPKNGNLPQNSDHL